MGDSGEQALMLRFYADSVPIGKQISAQKRLSIFPMLSLWRM